MDLLTIILPFDPWCSNLGSLSISSTGNTNHKSGDLLYAWTVHSDCHLNYTNKVSERDIINLGIWLFIRAIKYQAHHQNNVMVGHLLYLIFIPFRKSLINLLSKTAWTSFLTDSSRFLDRSWVVVMVRILFFFCLRLCNIHPPRLQEFKKKKKNSFAGVSLASVFTLGYRDVGYLGTEARLVDSLMFTRRGAVKNWWAWPSSGQ